MSRSAQQILEDLGEALPQSLGDALQAAADEAIETVKSKLTTGPEATGALRGSIQAIVNDSDYTLSFMMNDYGYYQNFGVRGTNNTTTQEGLDENTALAFGVSEDYEFHFKKETERISKESGLHYGARWNIAHDGLNAKEFFNIEQFTQQVVDIINESNNIDII